MMQKPQIKNFSAELADAFRSALSLNSSVRAAQLHIFDRVFQVVMVRTDVPPPENGLVALHFWSEQSNATIKIHAAHLARLATYAPSTISMNDLLPSSKEMVLNWALSQNPGYKPKFELGPARSLSEGDQSWVCALSYQNGSSDFKAPSLESLSKADLSDMAVIYLNADAESGLIASSAKVHSEGVAACPIYLGSPRFILDKLNAAKLVSGNIIPLSDVWPDLHHLHCQTGENAVLQNDLVVMRTADGFDISLGDTPQDRAAEAGFSQASYIEAFVAQFQTVLTPDHLRTVALGMPFSIRPDEETLLILEDGSQYAGDIVTCDGRCFFRLS